MNKKFLFLGLLILVIIALLFWKLNLLGDGDYGEDKISQEKSSLTIGEAERIVMVFYEQTGKKLEESKNLKISYEKISSYQDDYKWFIEYLWVTDFNEYSFSDSAIFTIDKESRSIDCMELKNQSKKFCGDELNNITY